MVIVTDIKWRDKSGEIREGFYMDGYLAENLYDVPKFIKKDRDVVGIISGHGYTRNGKSTLMAQIGSFIAWRLAGGEMNLKRDDNGKFINPIVTKKPTKPIKFSLKNLAFSPDELMNKGTTLPKNSIIGYDEGKSGLDSKGTMRAINRLLDDFFQEIGTRNHVILIVLPNFFKLNEDIATTRSMFLVDTYCDENWNRGFFSFYGPKNKEWLYFLGKKKIGVGNKYSSVSPDFFGRFSNWSPFNRVVYEQLKRDSLKKKTLGTREEKIKKKYFGLLALYKRDTGKTTEEMAKGLSEVLFTKVSSFSLEQGLKDYLRYAERVNLGGDAP